MTFVMARTSASKAQFGGNDPVVQSSLVSNIAKKKSDLDVYGHDFLTSHQERWRKMGKTAGGALWLNEEESVSVFDFFQYWRNVADADINKCLRILAFLPMDEVNSYLPSGAQRLIRQKRSSLTKSLSCGEEKRKHLKMLVRYLQVVAPMQQLCHPLN